jgi:GTP-binding protein
VVLMIDSRLGFTDLDRQLLGLLAPRLACGAVRLLVLLTKVDKLTRSVAALALSSAQALLAETCPENADIGVALFSALKRIGVDDAAVVLHAWARDLQPAR